MATLPDYFTLYSLPRAFSADASALKQQFYALSRLHHPDKVATADAATQAEALRMAALTNDAYKTLTNPDRLMAYILKLQGVLEDEEHYTLPPDFLMEMMELNEAVDDGGEAGRKEWESEIRNWESGARPLMERYDAGDHSAALLAALKDAYFRKKYLLRLGERLA